jgi:hypothetical protein
MHRTPAHPFFGDVLANAFERRLLAWSRASLGLSALGGPLWLSYLLDGDFQALHRDSPNGELALSYGLSRRGAPFRGGETLLAKDELLDYFRSGAHRAGEAHAPMFDEVPSRFDRLVIFDARTPHAVRPVEGPRHPRDGRVAIQGWLRAAGCAVVKGERPEAEVTEVLNAALRRGRSAFVGAEGLVSVRFEVTRQGRVRRAEAIFDGLAETGRGKVPRAGVAEAIVQRVEATRLGPGTTSKVVAPIVVGEAGNARVPTA